jgi:hypothetical protein
MVWSAAMVPALRAGSTVTTTDCVNVDPQAPEVTERRK